MWTIMVNTHVYCWDGKHVPVMFRNSFISKIIMFVCSVIFTEPLFVKLWEANIACYGVFLIRF